MAFQTHVVAGWTVRADGRLMASNGPATRRALELLAAQLEEVARVVPSNAVVELRRVPLWFSPAYPGFGPRAEYHPDAGWLASNRRDPTMARAVEFTNIPEFEEETRQMPSLVLHELAHAYHDRVLPKGFADRELREAHARAVASGTYDHVGQRDARGGVSRDRAYALTNPMEFFAELSEAYFSRNDFFPFDRAELERAGPESGRLVERLWGVRGP